MRVCVCVCVCLCSVGIEHLTQQSLRHLSLPHPSSILAGRQPIGPAVLSTSALAARLASNVSYELRREWRFQQLLYRAYYDSYQYQRWTYEQVRCICVSVCVVWLLVTTRLVMLSNTHPPSVKSDCLAEPGGVGAGDPLPSDTQHDR